MPEKTTIIKKKKTVSFSKDSANLFFHILTKCNLNCIHCYINEEQHGSEILPLSTIESWLEIFAHKKKQNIIFLGGEPTLHPDLPEAIKKAKTLGFNSITVDTNGYLFNDFLSKTDPDILDYLSFSLDGVSSETNDRIRGKGSYDKCINGIKKANKKGFCTSLIYTVSNLNISELDKIPSLLKDLKIDRFFIQVIGIRGKSAKNKAGIIQAHRAEWLDIIPETARNIADLGITVTYPKVYLNNNEKFECAGIVADNYFIFPNGRVYRCPLCEDFPMHSMIIKDNSLMMQTGNINESHLFGLNIPEGCVMNKIIQPENIICKDGIPEYKIACCMLKEEIKIP